MTLILTAVRALEGVRQTVSSHNPSHRKCGMEPDFKKFGWTIELRENLAAQGLVGFYWTTLDFREEDSLSATSSGSAASFKRVLSCIVGYPGPVRICRGRGDAVRSCFRTACRHDTTGKTLPLFRNSAPCPAPRAKIFHFPKYGNYPIYRPVPRSHEGASRSSRTSGAGCDGRWLHRKACGAIAYGQAVWS